jgi:TRAP-type uncharacterized transport system fused permease subunit
MAEEPPGFSAGRDEPEISRSFLFLAALKAFLAFCAAASAVYFSGQAVRHVARQLLNWNHLTDFYRLIPLCVVPWVLFSRSYPISVRALAAIALSLQAVLLFLVASANHFCHGCTEPRRHRAISGEPQRRT